MRTRRAESLPYQLFMLALCVFTLLVLTTEVVLRVDGQTRVLLDYADTAICGLFFLDFLLCLYSAENRWRYLYTWGWLDLASSIPVIAVARWGRAARAARILRVLRGVRAAKILGSHVLAKRAESTLLAASLIGILLMVFASVSILHVETAKESNIKTANDALWWAISTITTVGYGDRYPVTTEGRLVAALLMCAGVGLFGMFSGLLAAWFVAPGASQQRSELDALREEVRQLRVLLEKTVGRSVG